MKRRRFLKVAGGVAGIIASGCNLSDKPDQVEIDNSQIGILPRRALGRTGETLSIVGFPGNGLQHYSQQEATTGIHRAFERGINYFDVAPAYGDDGDCEKKMGIGFQGIRRDEIFLSNKTTRYDREGSRLELDRSLKRLKTDYFDLYQLHCLRKPDEAEQILGPGGAMETILKAREEGKIRYIGFSAHTTLSALAAMKGFQFDTVMFPINFVEHFKFGFGKEILELAEQLGMSVIAIKPTSAGSWPENVKKQREWWFKVLEEKEQIRMAMRFALAPKPVVSAVPASFLDHLDTELMLHRKINHSPKLI